MSNTLERIRKNKNVRPDSSEVDDLLKHSATEEIENINESENTSVNESGNDNVFESENNNKNVNAYIIANKKPKFEELHKKDTFWVKNEILDKLHGMTKGNKGLKTQIINEAIELFFKKNKI